MGENENIRREGKTWSPVWSDVKGLTGDLEKRLSSGEEGGGGALTNRRGGGFRKSGEFQVSLTKAILGEK